MDDSASAAGPAGAGHQAARVRAALLSRRYYPVAIGAAFLGLVVGFFPSTVPTSSLGFIPKIAPRAPLAAPAPAPAPASATTTPPLSPIPADFGFAGSTPFGSDTGAPAVGPPPSAPVTSPATTGSTGSGAVGTGTHATCALPLPAEPPAPPAAELLELLTVAGPLGPEATAGTAALAPIIPEVAPLFPLAGGIAGGKSGVLLSTTLVEIANLEDKLFAPFSKQIAAITPTAVADDEKFLQAIGPLLTLAANLPDLACVGDVEIAAAATIAPADYPAAIPLTAYGTSATSLNNRVVTASTSWAEGVTPGFAQAVNGLIAQGVPVDVHLYDDAPAGHAADASGFASWVTSTVTSFPRVAVWEIDPYTSASAPAGAVPPAGPAAALVGGLSAAAHARAPGQLLGVGLPMVASTWWPQLATALAPAVRAVVNFVGVDTTALNGGAALAPAGLHWILSLLRQGTLAEAGWPSQIPLFVTAGSDTAVSAAAQAVDAAQDAADLTGLGVGLFTWSSPSTIGGGLFRDPLSGERLLDALARGATP